MSSARYIVHVLRRELGHRAGTVILLQFLLLSALFRAIPPALAGGSTRTVDIYNVWPVRGDYIINYCGTNHVYVTPRLFGIQDQIKALGIRILDLRKVPNDTLYYVMEWQHNVSTKLSALLRSADLRISADILSLNAVLAEPRFIVISAFNASNSDVQHIVSILSEELERNQIEAVIIEHYLSSWNETILWTLAHKTEEAFLKGLQELEQGNSTGIPRILVYLKEENSTSYVLGVGYGAAILELWLNRTPSPSEVEEFVKWLRDQVGICNVPLVIHLKDPLARYADDIELLSEASVLPAKHSETFHTTTNRSGEPEDTAITSTSTTTNTSAGDEAATRGDWDKYLYLLVVSLLILPVILARLYRH